MKVAVADLFLLVILPYLSVVMFVFASWRRARKEQFTVTSLSSQFLEDKTHFWGSAPFHFGLLAVLAAHLFFFAAPKSVLAWNGAPARLLALEAAGFAFGALTLAGLAGLVWRRLSDPKAAQVTSPADWLVLALLLAQTMLGLHTAGANSWGSSWFAAALTPYLRSLLVFSPEPAYAASLPWPVKAHIAGAFALLAALPFTRLIHALTFPLPYLWRKPQIVRWSRPRSIS